MTDLWSPERTADELLKTIPNLGRFMARYMRDSDEAEMTLMRVFVLRQLQEHPLTASELAKKRHVSLQAASVLVQNLVERGWVVRVPNPNDKRQFLLQITPEGSTHAQSMTDQIVRRLAEFLVDLTPDEIAAAQVFLPAVRRVLAVPTAADLKETQ